MCSTAVPWQKSAAQNSWQWVTGAMGTAEDSREDAKVLSIVSVYSNVLCHSVLRISVIIKKRYWRGLSCKVPDESIEFAPMGAMKLFFGCRRADLDFLYQKELTLLHELGACLLCVCTHV